MQIIYKTVRIFSAVIAVPVSLICLRASFQVDYEWGLFAIKGVGREGDYLSLLFFAFLAWATFLFQHWYKRKWYYIFPVLFYTVMVKEVILSYLNSKTLSVQGDAWGLSINLTSGVFIAISIILLALSIIWTLMDLRQFQPRSILLRRVQIVQLSIFVFLEVIACFLFALGSGGQHSHIDRFAVILTILNGLFLVYINETSTQTKKAVKN